LWLGLSCGCIRRFASVAIHGERQEGDEERLVPRRHASLGGLFVVGASLLVVPAAAGEKSPEHSVARIWNDALLNAIRKDTARPTVHARNLFHTSVAMWDAWAAYDDLADQWIHQEKVTARGDVEAARDETISYAAYRTIRLRFMASPGAAITLPLLDSTMVSLGYDPTYLQTAGDSPAALGNRIAATLHFFAVRDGSNQLNNYASTWPYTPANPPLVVGLPGNPGMTHPNRWQPLALSFFIDQSGIVLGPYPAFITPHWGTVVPFALTQFDRDETIPPPYGVYHNPGPQPLLGGVGDAAAKAAEMQVIRYSSYLTPADGVMMDVSPASMGDNPLGTMDGDGYDLNPVTGLPYEPQMVKRGDWARILAEFWADGPNSETPPGHWNTLANDVMDHPGFERRIGGKGPILDTLEYDVKLYLALNGALHDAAVTTWGIKGYYDTSRPISVIRYMCDKGQCSDPKGPSFHIEGIPLEPGLIEVITRESSARGERHEHLAAYLDEIAIYAWQGNPVDPDTQIGDVGWIRAKKWVPYQLSTFVTPPFGGYTSGHSCFSRSGAEVMTRITGTEFLPDGYYEYVFKQGQYLSFEYGPSQDMSIPFASYYDAADQAAISRIYGGIHPSFDDFPSRINGSKIGPAAYTRATKYWYGAVSNPWDLNIDGQVSGFDLAILLGAWGACPNDEPCDADFNGDGAVNGLDLAILLGEWG
jgi:Dockerin type I domain